MKAARMVGSWVQMKAAWMVGSWVQMKAARMVRNWAQMKAARMVQMKEMHLGTLGDKRIVMGLSCWHLSHPNHFCSPCNDLDGQLSHVAASGEGIASPLAL